MIETTLYFGPAKVTETEGPPQEVRVAPAGRADSWARLALALPYQAAVGDEVLAIGEDRLYVIGVLRGSGLSHLRVAGRLRIDAPLGIQMTSQGPIETLAPSVRFRVGTFEIVARRLLESVHDAYRWVRGLFQLRSRRMRMFAESTAQIKAEQAYLTSRETMNIDGKTIHLG